MAVAHYRSGVDPRLRTAVESSLRWYEDIFAAHGIPTAVQDGLWSALGPPPRWHSAAKTLEPTDLRAAALRAVEAFEHCGIADSFGVLDFSDAGFSLLFEATWVHHPPLGRNTAALPAGWSVIGVEAEFEAWNQEHDTLDVLVPSLLSHSRFRFLGENAGGTLLGGAVLHDTGGGTVGLSNQWAIEGRSLDPGELLACADVLHPGRAVVGYERAAGLEDLLDAGFSALGPHHVWAR